MITLCMRTDKPLAELYVYRDDHCIAKGSWEAHRSLAETLHVKIEQVLKQSGVTIHDVNKIVIFKGPGSFTGLRIGMSVANAFGYALQIPVVATEGEQWLAGVSLETPHNFVPQMPHYGADPHITQQKK